MSKSDDNPFATIITQMQDMARAMPAMDAFDATKLFDPKEVEKLWPTMPHELMEAMFGKQANPDGLDARTRLWLTLAGLVMQGAVNESAVRLTVRHLAEAGVSGKEIAEAIGLLAAFAGVPAATKAAGLAEAALEQED